MTAKADEICMIGAGATDPDGDSLTYRWFVYPEPGTYRGEMLIRENDRPITFFRVPKDATGKTIHVVLKVTDDGTPALTRYRRVVVTVEP
jgi:hypothetical protein